jgi:putative phosphonate catabolism associated alcohol dehydrogenase
MSKATLMVFNGHGQDISQQEYPLPKLESGEILVKNLYTSICGSDLHTFCGLRNEKVPTVLGHEIVGEILAFASADHPTDHLGNVLRVGDRITWSIFASNPNTELAKAGMPQKSEGLFKYGHAQVTSNDALHGGLSTHCVLKVGTAILKIDEEIPLSVAAIINCAVATVAGALRLAGHIRQKKVLITGSGLLGLVCAAMCKHEGAESIHVADINSLRLEQAKTFGASNTYLTGDQTTTLPDGIDVTFDMSGAAEAMESGLKALTVGGTAIWVGAVFKGRNVQVDAESIVRRLVTIKGLHNYNFEDFVYAVDFISNNYKTFPFESVVSKEFDLSDAALAFQYAVDHKPLRVGVHINK